MGRWTGSWLSGPGSLSDAGSPPGVRLGLPAEGAGSVAGTGERLLAFGVDLLASVLLGGVLVLLVHHPSVQQRNYAYDVAFVLQYLVLLPTSGQTLGMRMLGLRVIGNGGAPPAFGWTFVRTVLLVLLIPALIWDRDRRGLHDKASGTTVVRAR